MKTTVTYKNYKVVIVDVDGNELFSKHVEDFTEEEVNKYAFNYVANYNANVNYEIYEL